MTKLSRVEQEIADEYRLTSPVILGNENYFMYNVRDLITKNAKVSYESASEVGEYYFRKGLVKSVYICNGYCGYILIDEKYLTCEEVNKAINSIQERKRPVIRSSEPIVDTFSRIREEREEERCYDAFERNGRHLSFYERLGD